MSRAVDRITALLEVLANQARPSSLSDISELTGLDKSTAHRFLRACERQKIVRRDPDTLRYSLGIRIIEWGGQALDKIDVVRISDPVLVRLNLQTRETVALHVRDGNLRTALAVHNSPRMTVVSLHLGWTAPLPLGAAGKVLLAFAPPPDVEPTFDAFPEIGPELRQSITSDLPRIRENGYATSRREMSDHAWSVAAPIFGSGARLLATIAISAPLSRFSPEIETNFIELILAAADEISEMMGSGQRRPRVLGRA